MGTDFSESISFQKTFEHVETCAIIAFDPSKNIRTWNKGAARLFGYEADEIIGRHISTINENYAGSPHFLDIAGSSTSEEECWQRRADGTLFWAKVITSPSFNSDGETVGFNQIIQDITFVGIELTGSSKQALGDTLGRILDYAILLLDKDGHIHYANKGAEKIKRYEITELIGQHVRIFYSADDQSARIPESMLAEAAEKGTIYYEGWRFRKDGTKFWGSVLLSALTDYNRQVIGYYKITRDLTDRKMAEEAQLLYLDQLEKHSKEVEELAYISSHDLKEPVRTILSYLELFREEYLPPASGMGATYIDIIQQCAERMQQLINGILEYSLIGAKRRLTSVDLNVVLSEVERDLYESLKSTGSVINRHSLPIVAGYGTELRQLFQNLISNAIKFRKENEPAIITISASFRHSLWTFVVEDNGIGFDPRFTKRIFQLFQRLNHRSKYEGTGIGLSYAKKIVGLHNGEIWAESTPGKGSRFFFTIPEIIYQ